VTAGDIRPGSPRRPEGSSPELILVAVALALSETGPGVALGAVCAAREAALANWHSRARPIGTPAAAGPVNGEGPLSGGPSVVRVGEPSGV
jgi:hypothetical protein